MKGAYIGLCGYATLLAQFKQPSTTAEAAPRAGVTAKIAVRLLKQFHALRIVHRVGWVRPAKHGIDQPVYALGSGQDVPSRPTIDGKPMPHADFVPRLQPKVVAFASAVHALQQPVTLAELAHEAGLDANWAGRLIAHMRSSKVRLVRICDYAPPLASNGHRARVYCFAPDARDAPRPASARTRSAPRPKRLERLRGGWHTTVVELKRTAGIARPACRM